MVGQRWEFHGLMVSLCVWLIWCVAVAEFFCRKLKKAIVSRSFVVETVFHGYFYCQKIFYMAYYYSNKIKW